jgi:hypothetical protein
MNVTKSQIKRSKNLHLLCLTPSFPISIGTPLPRERRKLKPLSPGRGVGEMPKIAFDTAPSDNIKIQKNC